MMEGAEQMAQWLIVLAVLPWGLTAVPTRHLSTICKSTSKGSEALFWRVYVLYAYDAVRYSASAVLFWTNLTPRICLVWTLGSLEDMVLGGFGAPTQVPSCWRSCH